MVINNINLTKNLIFCLSIGKVKSLDLSYKLKKNIFLPREKLKNLESPVEISL